MPIPSVTCNDDVVVNVTDNPTGFSSVLGVVATPGPIVQYAWEILYTPSGGESSRNAGDFSSGKAYGQTPTIVIPQDVEGSWVIQCKATNAFGVSNPSLDAANGQQSIVVKTSMIDLPLPGDQQFGWGSYLRDALKKLEANASLWFEWNGADLSQFGTKRTGAHVTGSTVAIETVGGLNWVAISSSVGAGTSYFFTGGVFLPIAVTPPTKNYIVTADFVNAISGGSNQVGAFVCARFDWVGPNLYAVVYNGFAGNVQFAWKTKDAIGYSIGTTQTDPTVTAGTNTGMEIGIMVEGDTHLKALLGERQCIADTSNQVTTVGQAAIGSSCNGVPSITVKNLFRNIRCFSV